MAQRNGFVAPAPSFTQDRVVGQFPICRLYGKVDNFLEADFWRVRGDFPCPASASIVQVDYFRVRRHPPRIVGKH